MESHPTDTGDRPQGEHGFDPTRWTLVRQAGIESAEGRAALADLSAAYWEPVYRFLRRDGRDDETARELAQEFFARLLERGGLGGADPARGRFRTFLLGAVKHFLQAQRVREQALKRGGGTAPESLEAAAVADVPWEPSVTAAADTVFDRDWALRVMGRALEGLESEWRGEGRGEQFALLKPWLVGEGAARPQEEVARQLGVTGGAVKVAVHRLRKRYRDMVRAEIASTLGDGESVDEELRYLVEVLSSGG